MKKAEYESTTRQLSEPSLDFLKEKSTLYDSVIVSANEFRQLQSQVDNPSDEFLKEKSTLKGFVLIKNNDYEELLRKADSPTEEELKVQAEKNNLSLISTDYYNTLKQIQEQPSKEFLEAKAGEMDMVLVGAEEYADLKDRCSNKDRIFSSVKSLGYIPITESEFTSLKAEMLSSATLPQIQDRLESMDYFAVTRKYYEDSKVPPLDRCNKEDIPILCSKFSMKALTDEEYEQLSREPEPKKYTLEELALFLDIYNYVAIPDKELKALKEHAEHPSYSFLEEKAHELGHILVDKKTYDKQVEELSHPSFDVLSDKIAALGYVTMEKDEMEELLRSRADPSVDYIREKASDKNLFLISETEWKTLDSPTIDYLRARAEKLDYSVLPTSELSTLKEMYLEPTVEFLREKAKAHGLLVVRSDEYTQFKDMYEHPTVTFLVDNAQLLGKVMIDESEYKNLKQEPSVDSIKGLANKHDLIILWNTKDIPTVDLQTQVDNERFILVAKSSYNRLLNNPDPDEMGVEQLNELCKKHNMTMLTDEEYRDLTRHPDESDIIKLGTEMGMMVLSNEDYEAKLSHDIRESITPETLQELAKSHNLRLVSATEDATNRTLSVTNEAINDVPDSVLATTTYGGETVPTAAPLERLDNGPLSQINEIELDTIQELANGLGFRLVPLAAPVITLSDEEVREYAKSKNIVLIPAEEAKKLKQGLSIDEMADVLRCNGMVVVPENHFRELTENAYQRTPTKSSLSEATKGDNSPFHVRSSFGFDSENLETKLDLAKLRTIAREYGLVCLPITSFVASSFGERPDESCDVFLNRAYYHFLSSKIRDVMININDKELLRECQKRGVQSGGFNVSQPTSPNESTAVSYRNSITSSGYITFAGPMAVAAASAAYCKGTHSGVPRSTSVQFGPYSEIDGVIRSSTTNSVGVARGVNSGLSRVTSRDNATLSQANISRLNELSILPALIQVVIGEYVYKYTNKASRLSSGVHDGVPLDRRYERYFWVNPHTLTLYWADSNPAEEISSRQNIRAVTIWSVASVSDHNQLPSGLYHRSILVTTIDGRTVKFTCHTKQRHHIWLSALRYLVQRHMDGSDFQDILDQETGDMKYYFDKSNHNFQPVLEEAYETNSVTTAGTKASGAKKMKKSSTLPALFKVLSKKDK